MSYEINAVIREAQGTGASRRLRREGQVPAVLYGENTEPMAIAIEHKAMFYALEKESFHAAIIKLNLDGKSHDVMVRDFQMHPFKQQVQHIDFQAVDMNKPLKIRVPVHLLNAEMSPAIKLQGGRVSLLNATVEVLALPKDVPVALEIDVSKVTAGQILHLSDIVFPEGVTSVALKRNENLAVAAITGKKR